MEYQTILIGTRKSPLAMAQAHLVGEALEKNHPGLLAEYVPMDTKGDLRLEIPLAHIGGKGLFTKELEEKLDRGELHLAVHSAKDLPLEMPQGLQVMSVGKREDRGDVLVSRREKAYSTLVSLPPGARVGTSSGRRRELALLQNPYLDIVPVRGNVGTRIQKLLSGEADALILAGAGLIRLREYSGLLGEEREALEGLCIRPLDPETFLPAPAQGIVAVQYREAWVEALLKPLSNPDTEWEFLQERRFLQLLHADCHTPCGLYAGRKEKRIYGYFRGREAAAEQKKLCENGEGSLEKTEDVLEKLAAVLCNPVPESKGAVCLCGAGPGSMELVTQGCLDQVKGAQVILYDHLIPPSLLNYASPKALLVDVGKRAGSHPLSQERINGLLVHHARRGKRVLRLKGGDPFIFGRGGEEAGALKEAGLPFSVLQGVSSALAVPGAAGISLTHRELASSLHIFTAHRAGEGDLDYAMMAKLPGTLVFLMGFGKLSILRENLLKQGMDPAAPMALISRGCLPGQRVLYGTLGSIEKELAKNPLPPPGVIVLGGAARISFEGFRECVEKKPLLGKVVLLTATKEVLPEFREAFQERGAAVVELSLNLIRPRAFLDDGAMERIRSSHWLVFTSANGVAVFFEALKEQGDLRMAAGKKFAVIGQGTARALKKQGFQADFVPRVFDSQTLLEEWPSHMKEGERALLLRGRQGSPVLAKGLLEKQIPFWELVLYDTVMDFRREEELNRLLPEADYCVLASASAARAMGVMLRNREAAQGKLVSIGPVTSEEIRKQGLPLLVQAKKYDKGGLADAVEGLEG